MTDRQDVFDTIKEAKAALEAMHSALVRVVRDVREYETLNNLHPNPGRKYCWDSVANAIEILGFDPLTKEAGNEK